MRIEETGGGQHSQRLMRAQRLRGYPARGRLFRTARSDGASGSRSERFGAGGGGSVEPHVPSAWRRTGWSGEEGPVRTGGLPRPITLSTMSERTEKEGWGGGSAAEPGTRLDPRAVPPQP